MSIDGDICIPRIITFQSTTNIFESVITRVKKENSNKTYLHFYRAKTNKIASFEDILLEYHCSRHYHLDPRTSGQYRHSSCSLRSPCSEPWISWWDGEVLRFAKVPSNPEADDRVPSSCCTCVSKMCVKNSMNYYCTYFPNENTCLFFGRKIPMLFRLWCPVGLPVHHFGTLFFTNN